MQVAIVQDMRAVVAGVLYRTVQIHKSVIPTQADGLQPDEHGKAIGVVDRK